MNTAACLPPPAVPAGPFPAEVETIIAALESRPRPLVERHRLPRRRHRVLASLYLYSRHGSPPAELFTRHVNAKGLGFLVDGLLPVGHGATVVLVDFEGQLRSIRCTILRCGLVGSGWYEGACYFNREQTCFAHGAP